MIKINLGCGQQILEGWINVDYSLGAKMAKLPFFKVINGKLKLFSSNWDDRILLHDLRKPFPWADSSIDMIYSSHTLEHLTREEGLNFIHESYRVLKPGGIIRIVVPDLAANIEHYLCGKTRADYFLSGMQVLYSTDKNPTNSLIKKLLVPLLECPHKCYYDASTLITILNEAGFHAKSMKAFDSKIPGISEIELEDRTVHAIMIEGTVEAEFTMKLRSIVESAASAIPEEALDIEAIAK